MLVLEAAAHIPGDCLTRTKDSFLVIGLAERCIPSDQSNMDTV
jgi:hypothetical protein